MMLRDRLARALDRPADGLLSGDLDLDPDPDREGDDIPPVPAAVLVPIVDRARPGLLLTRRTETLRRHAGQIAFPGGRIDPDDADVIAAALREAEEEIGLPPRLPDVIGTADPYRTVTGFSVTPVIAIIPPNLPLVPQEAEVAEVFEVPLSFVLDPTNQARRTGAFRGKERHYIEILWGDRRIWGATAAMIVNLARRLDHG